MDEKKEKKGISWGKLFLLGILGWLLAKLSVSLSRPYIEQMAGNDRIDEQLKKQVTEECIKKFTQDSCDCIYNEIRKVYTLDDLEKMGNNNKNIDNTTMQEISKSCNVQYIK